MALRSFIVALTCVALVGCPDPDEPNPPTGDVPTDNVPTDEGGDNGPDTPDATPDTPDATPDTPDAPDTPDTPDGTPDTPDTADTDATPTDPTCENYCALVTANCAGADAQYADEQACLDYCNTAAALPVGTAADTSGNTIGCRTYHAIAAVDLNDTALHCPHAGPTGGDVCGTYCDNYCHLSATNCTGDNEIYADDTACQAACANFDTDGAVNDAAGDTMQCRIYHLGVAGSDPPDSNELHCPHGAEDGGGVCVDVPSCDDYCTAITAACTGADAQYTDEAECLGACAAAGWDIGTSDDTDTNTLGCRIYHADFAVSSGDTATHCPHAGYTGGGVCGSWCDNYCDQALANCTGADEIYVDDAECQTACAAMIDTGAAGDINGDTVQCRLTYAATAIADTTFCAYAAEDGGGICTAPPTCEEYCTLVTANCTGADAQYADEADCLAYCNTEAQIPAGTHLDTGENSIGCRLYHADAAVTLGDTALHCPHAGPSGGGVCGSWCDNYCHLSDTNCTDTEAITFTTDCQTDCEAYADTGAPGATAGDSVQCRIYHLGVAGDDAQGGSAVHCPHGAPDGGGVCVGATGPTCEDYCSAITATCTGADAQYIDEQDCLDYCNTEAQLPVGTVDDTSGNTIGCRIYHVQAAIDQNDTALHCPHAGPSGGNVCGTWCDNYCHLSDTNCTGGDAISFTADCQTDCDGYVDTGGPGDTAGDSVQCRIYHLGVAGDSAQGGATVHCPHGAPDGGGVCVDPTPSCAEYCTTVTANCTGANAQYADEQACLDYCSTHGQLPLGDVSDTGGNTVGCRTYHADAAATQSDPDLHCPHAGPSGGNVCGTWCENYCHLSDTNCTGGDAISFGTDCLTDCDAYDASGAPGITAGDSVQCRIYHLGVAGDPSQGGSTVHCPHGAPDGGGVCVAPNPTCAEYCSTVMANCTGGDAQYVDEAACLDYCNTAGAWPEGQVDDTSGNSIGCRTYHAGVAGTSGDTALHCPHAGPSGGGVCGTYCDNYCQLALQNCTGGDELYADAGACADACAFFPAGGTPGDTAGNSVQCRIYHLGVAPSDTLLHCPHGGVDGGGVCADAGPGGGGDTCAEAVVVPSVPFTDSGDSSLGTDALDPGACIGGGGGEDVVYSFTPSVTGSYSITVTTTGASSGVPSLVYVTTDCATPDNDCVGADDFWQSTTSDLTVSLTAGTEYFVVIDGYGGESGAYDITIAGTCLPSCGTATCGDDGCGGSCGTCDGADVCDPADQQCKDPATIAGNTCANPLTIDPAGDVVITGDSSANTDEAQGDACTDFTFGTGGADAIYSFTPTTAGVYTIARTSSSGPDFLYVGTACGAITTGECLAFDDSASSPEVIVDLEAGTEYYVFVDGWNGGDAAAYELTVSTPCIPSCAGAACGGDGCGGSCGTCDAGEACDAGICVSEADLPGNTCNNPFLADAFPYTNDGDTSTGSTGFFDSSGCGGSAGGAGSADDVYAVTADQTWVYQISFTGFDGRLTTMSACDATATACIDTTDAVGQSETQQVAIEAGNTVFAVVDGWSSSSTQEDAYTFTTDYVANDCELYCETFLATCDAATYATGGEFTDQGSCETWCGANLADGAIGDTGNDTRACRTYHAILAASDVIGGTDAVHCPHAAPDGGGVCADAGATSKLVINEIDYDQDSTDNNEWVEIVNVGTADATLAGYTVEFVNGSNDTIYDMVDLGTAVDGSGTAVPLLAPGEFLMLVAPGSAVEAGLDGAVARIQLPDATNAIQNGNPDGVQIVDGGGSLEDSLSYEGEMAVAGDWLGTEGTGAVQDLVYVTLDMSLSRCPQGTDSDDNSSDFARSFVTPAAANSCQVPTYDADAGSIFAAKCTPCHTGSGSGGHNIGSDYSSVDDEAALLAACAGLTKAECALQRIQDGSMPQGALCTGDPATDAGNAACLTQAEQDIIEAWVDNGWPEN